MKKAVTSYEVSAFLRYQRFALYLALKIEYDMPIPEKQSLG